MLLPSEEDYPEGCYVDFDLRIINLFKELAEAQKGIFDKLKSEYFSIKEKRNERPSRLSMYTYMDQSIYASIIKRSNLNIFKDYLSFLENINELDSSEKSLLGTKAHYFIKTIENTRMSKLYKMPILLAFYNKGNMKLSINDDDIYESFKEFYSRGSNAIDMLKDVSTYDFKSWGESEYLSLAKRNPIYFLQQSSPDFFSMQDGLFCLDSSLQEFTSNKAFIKNFKDAIDYRTRQFYKERLDNWQAER